MREYCAGLHEALTLLRRWADKTMDRIGETSCKIQEVE